MATTIQVSEKLVEELRIRKFHNSETYEEVIWDLLEDTRELDTKTKEQIAQSVKEFEQGKYLTHEQVKKELGL